MSRKILIMLGISAAIATGAMCGPIHLKEFTFNDIGALDKWSTMVLNGQVNYELIQDGIDGYVQAISDKACSALYHRVSFKLKNYPYMTWKWRAVQFPDITKAGTLLEKDDYAARVYVIFPFLTFSSSKFLEYVWADGIPVGTVMDSPSGKNVKQIVVRDGKPSDVNEWYSETRNVYEDYKNAFGSEPGMDVGAIAIMCDADGTKTSAESFFDDIKIETQEDHEGRNAQ